MGAPKRRAVTFAIQTDARSSGLMREWAGCALRGIRSRNVGTVGRRATTRSGRAHVVADWGTCGRRVRASAHGWVEPPRFSYIAPDVKAPCPYPSADLLPIQIPRWAIRASQNQPYCPIRRVVMNPSGAARTSGFFFLHRRRARAEAKPAPRPGDRIGKRDEAQRLPACRASGRWSITAPRPNGLD